MKPNCVVVGTKSEGAKKSIIYLYMPFARHVNPMICMSERSFNLTKYTAN